MTDIVKHDCCAEIKETIRKSIQEELKSYRIPKEQHYQDHLWIYSWREWQIQMKNSFIKGVVAVIISTICALLLYGFIFFGRMINR